ncbi:MAG: phage baseplate assembly protein V, partial [Flavobacteriales bacterium]
SNTDPENKGRVQVRFDWQLHDTTEFIRVMSPDAGSSDKVSKNRGFMSIPEVGDQVMVNFQHNHPDRPFVMGGMFHGISGGGGGENNHIKSITTRSGCTIIFDDTDNQGSITVKDPSGNIWYMDGQGNIDVTAPKNMNFNVGDNFNINVGQNMSTNVGANQSNTVGLNSSETVGMNKTIRVGLMKTLSVGTDFMTNVVGKLTHYVKGSMETFGEKEHKLTTLKGMAVKSKGKVEHHSEKEVQNNSGEKSKNH